LIDVAEHSIDGVGTSTAGFAGITERGPEYPCLTTSWLEYQRVFGGHLPGTVSYLPRAVQGFFENGGQRLYIARITGTNESAYADGLAALGTVDEVALLSVPDEVRFATATTAGPITAAVIAQCERRKDRFGIVSCAGGRSDAPQLRPPADTKQAAFYYPWIDVNDPLTGGSLRIPPTGHIAGVYARTDAARGVAKAPANEELRGATGLEFRITESTQNILSPRGVNTVRDFRPAGRGIRVWGARTMSADPEWKYVNVRRLFIFIEQSISQGTQWAVFEPNGEQLWNNVKTSIGDFLLGLWRGGVLMGNKPEEAFFVKVDRSTMTQDDLDNGRLVCLIGIAPVRPAEFVIFRIGQKTASGGA
jgi:phage tail sheath protein FI